MTNTHISVLSCTVLAAAALVCVSSGAARADDAAKFKPTAANLKHFVLVQGDLPDGYKRDDRMVSRSPGGCGDLGRNPAATRAYKHTLRALGFRRCASASFSKEDQTQSDEELPMELTGEYASEAILMRQRSGTSARQARTTGRDGCWDWRRPGARSARRTAGRARRCAGRRPRGRLGCDGESCGLIALRARRPG